MRKDKYEISLWEDVISGGNYKLVTNLQEGKSYHYRTNNKYSLPVEKKLIDLCEGFPSNWYEDNEGKNKVPNTIKFPSNDQIYYYFIDEAEGYWGISGSTINLYNNAAWYEMAVAGHYEEEKLCVIGSDTMTAEFRAREPRLVENINGTTTFTFKIFYTYIDTKTGEKKNNPFLKLLVNERKVKVKWKNKWYNLIIKGIQEDSNGKTFTFTCKDQYINELSKTGFGLIFSNDSMNNQGTIDELGERVLKGTDWQLDPSQKAIIRQQLEEPVYELHGQYVKAFTAKTIGGKDIPISAGDKILVYYSVYANKSTFFQFHYVPDGNYSLENNSILVTNGESCFVDNVKWSGNYVKNAQGKTLIKFPDTPMISSNYRAKRYVKEQLQEYESLTGAYCKVYNTKTDGTGKKVYGFVGTRTADATTVTNLLTINGTNGFDDNSNKGYIQPPNNPTTIDMPFGLYPTDEANLDKIHSYLKFEYRDNCAHSSGEVRFLNRGVSKNTQFLPEEGIAAGDVYIFRYKVALDDKGAPALNDEKEVQLYAPSEESEAPINPRFGLYKEDDFSITTNKEDKKYIFRKGAFSIEEDEDKEPWIVYKLICKTSISRSEILRSNFDFIFGVRRSCWLKEAQLFKEEYGKDINGDTIRLNPNSIDGTAVVAQEYRYFYADDAKQATKKTELRYCYRGLEDSNRVASTGISEDDETAAEGQIVDYKVQIYPIYPKNEFEKIRSIEAKQSNRFNILQTLAETFECYPKFEILNDPETGKIKYVNGVPQKFVSFHENIGQETGLTFTYGIDLKTISRTINSDQIVTKTIVLQNTNEIAKNGFCTISRANDNPSKETFILNFDYYISHGLISEGALNMDLYDTSGQSIGYYHNLKEIYTQYDYYYEQRALKQTEFDKLEKQITVYDADLKEIDEDIIETVTKISVLAGRDFATPNSALNWAKIKNHKEVKDLAIVWANLKNNRKSYKEAITKLKNLLYENTSTYTCIKDLIQRYERIMSNPDWEKEEDKGCLEKIEDLHERFYKKYSRYIQEGSWSSEKYFDDNLYYYDAQSVAYTSSRPQVQYNISVLRLSALDEFKNRHFELGDIAAIQDTEFFGYKWVDGIRTPYKEKVLISEITSNFESPENDSLKIQNYKTQFEDLFQRITSTTQSLQYSSGEYQKAANIVDSNGTIKASILQNSLALNENIMISYQNNAITQDATGITLTDISDVNRKVKLTSGGIIFTNDGEHWRTGIDADGVRADYLTTGAINTDKIMIYSGGSPSFRWTSTGLDAYKRNEKNEIAFNSFVRFDQYGIYGVESITEDEEGNWKPTKEQDIWDNAAFGMTWKGFFMKNKDGKGWVEVSSENDIAVFKTITENEVSRDTEKIKIGRLKTIGDSYFYGLRISDDSGAVVMETNEDGQLWLKDKLRVETYDKGEVQIGKLDTGETGEHGGRVIAALEKSNATEELKNKFIVYEDGHLEANGVTIKGNIEATGGKIGTLNVFDIEEALGAKKLEIDSDKGTFFTNNSPSQMVLTARVLTQETVTGWKWYYLKDGNRIDIEDANSQTYTVKASDIGLGEAKTYGVEATIEGNSYIAQIVLNHMALDVEIDLDLYSLEASWQEILKFIDEQGRIIVTPEIFKFVPKKGDKILTNSEGYNFTVYINNNEHPIPKKFHHWGEYTPTSVSWEDKGDRVLYYLSDEGNYVEINSKEKFNEVEQAYELIGNNKNIYTIEINNFLRSLEENDELLTESYSLLILKLISGDSEVGSTLQTFYYSITFGTSQDLATLSVHATGISQAIQNTSLLFNTEGLTLYNGGLKLISRNEATNKEDTVLFYNNGQLFINGNGTFTGEIKAGRGDFTGTIIAESGEIADLIIEKQVIYEIETIENSENLIETSEKSENKEIEKIPLETHSILRDENKNLIINGTTGAIETNNIILKSGAQIAEEIRLGNGAIKNPNWIENRNKEFITVENNNETIFSLDNYGFMKIGNISISGQSSLLTLGTDGNSNIILDGKNSIIYGNKWNITPEVASFNKINITNGIFETGKIQTVGGSMIFKSSSLIKEWVNPTTFILEKDINLLELDWIKISDSSASGNSSGDVDVVIVNIWKENINNEEVTYIQINTGLDIINKNYDTVTYLCSQEIIEEQQKEVVESGEMPEQKEIVIRKRLFNNIMIGINSNDAVAEELAPRALSFVEMHLDEETGQLLQYSPPKMIIGDLSEAAKLQADLYNLSGFGLYGDNVYLNGSLTTKINDNCYAGINTTSTIPATIFADWNNKLKEEEQQELDNSPIVFWAGAKIEEGEENYKNAIRNAPFQVTQNGSIYANQGIFEGTLITKSIIEGSVIRAAKIYGWQVVNDKGEVDRREAALQIYDTENGIEFMQEVEIGEPIKTLSLNNTGLKFKETNFIEFKTLEGQEDVVNACFNSTFSKNITTKNIEINDSKISFYSINNETEAKTNLGFLKARRNSSNSDLINNEWSLGIHTIQITTDPTTGRQIEEEVETEVLYYDNSSEKTVNATKFQVTENVIFGEENNGGLEYRKIIESIDSKEVIIGYDLYIS